MDERARKRKLEEVDEVEESDVEGIEKEKPKEGLKLAQEKKVKKQKTVAATSTDDETPTTTESTTTPAAEPTAESLEAEKAKIEERKLKQERKKEKKEKKLKKQAEKKQKDDERKIALPVEDIVPVEEKADEPIETQEVDAVEAIEDDLPSGEMDAFEAEGLEDKAEEDVTSQTSTPPSPTFDQPSPAEPSANTSTSSTIPPAKKPKHITLPTDPELLRARLNARIEALRAARKADGLDGVPVRNRADLMESRRKKEEQRRAHKKELRMKAKQEEDDQREALLASARDSPASSIMSPHIRSPSEQFSFGRVSFADGQELASDLSRLQAAPRKRGPQDPATALQASEKKRLRIAGLDDEKRADIEEKDLWLNAKKKAHGEKVRDDTNLLKKTLKRKETMKLKSANEWNERKEGVRKSQAMKQKKREGNLQKRIDEKGTKKGGKKGNAGKKTKPKSRPGFEGSFGGKRK